MRAVRSRRSRPPAPGLRANAGQFALLVGMNALVGGMVGQERTLLPLLARRAFHLNAFSSMLTFLLAFGLVKAFANLAAGAWADRSGRKPVLVAGWLAGIPVPLLLMWAPSWGWVIVANAFLGVNQGLSWSMTVTMKSDLVGDARRGLAMGLNEAAGYGGVAATAAATGFIAARAGLRPAPFFLGLAFAGLGIGLSAIFVRETYAGRAQARPPLRDVFVLTSFRERSLSACTQAGFVNNLNDGMAWGLFPIWFAGAGLSVSSIGILVALYPAVWAVAQLVTGPASDRIGRKPLIVWGLVVQAGAIAAIASVRSFGTWSAAAVLLGLGTAMVYPTLLAAIGDVARPAWRASAIGAYRFWRDAGFAAGALVAGVIADAYGLAAAIRTVAGVTALSAAIAAIRLRETKRPRASTRAA